MQFIAMGHHLGSNFNFDINLNEKFLEVFLQSNPQESAARYEEEMQKQEEWRRQKLQQDGAPDRP